MLISAFLKRYISTKLQDSKKCFYEVCYCYHKLYICTVYIAIVYKPVYISVQSEEKYS